MRLAGSRAVILLSNLDSASFAARLPQSAPDRTAAEVERRIAPVIEVDEHAVTKSLLAAGVDPSAVRGEKTAVSRDVKGLDVRVSSSPTRCSRRERRRIRWAFLEGSDPVLKHEYLVFSAHMDHIGITPGQPDSINNGADDDGSGTVGVIELAEAFSQAGARPKRSIIFLTVSGEEKGLWGSRYFTSTQWCRSTRLSPISTST